MIISIILRLGCNIITSATPMMVFVKLVLHTSAREPCVWICINKELHLKQVPDVLRVEHEDSLEQDHISRIHCDKLVFPGTTHSVSTLLVTVLRDGVLNINSSHKNTTNGEVVAQSSVLHEHSKQTAVLTWNE